MKNGDCPGGRVRHGTIQGEPAHVPFTLRNAMVLYGNSTIMEVAFTLRKKLFVLDYQTYSNNIFEGEKQQ